MANPDSLFNGQGETLDPHYRPDGTVLLKAAGHPINVTGATDDSAPQLVQDYPGQYTLTPTGLALQQGAGTLAAATYYYRVSATTAAGETLACAEVGLAIGATTGVILTWDAMAGASGYRVYGRATGAELFIAAVSGTTLTYTDSGALTPSGALPTANTARISQAVESTPATSTTGANTSVAASASSVVLLAANTARKGATIVNDSSALLYVRLAAAAASTSNYNVVLDGAAAAPFAYIEIPFNYTGEIRGIWASATGNARVGELT